MTPAELHSRILLHELRTILLDETREGPQIPYKELITRDPHNPASYLILSEELDDQLAELCRIQVELIKEWPLQTEPSPIGLETIVKSDPANHPFYTDHLHARLIGKLVDSKSHWAKLAERRWELTLPLYEIHYRDEWMEMRSHDLGRTTRMLTDILRYCALNQGKHVLGIFQSGIATHHQLLSHIWVELTGEEPLKRDYVGNPSWPMHIWGNHVHFGQPGMDQLINTVRVPAIGIPANPHEIPQKVRDSFERYNNELPWDIAYSLPQRAYLGVQTRTPDITFTDHACPTFPRRTITVEQAREEYALGPDWPNPQIPH